MKFMHISDLHLGKRLNDFSLIEDQEFILKRIINIAVDEKVDVMLIAGDIYDRSVPSEDAMTLWDEFLVSLSKKNIKVFAISGNHDSAIRFSDHNALMKSEGIYLSPVYKGETISYCLNDENGDINIYMMPFIKPANIRQYFENEDIDSYTKACKLVIDKMNIDTNKRNILLAHQFVTGSDTCESEDNFNVGGLDNVDVNVFEGFDYVALGHLHRPQNTRYENVRYSGTPLKYSFSEKNDEKSATIIDLKSKGDMEIKYATLEPKRDLIEVKGLFDEITSKSYLEKIDTNAYVRIVLTDENDVIDAMNKLRNFYPNIMTLTYDNLRTRTKSDNNETVDIDNKSPIELIEDFFEKQNGQKMTKEQKKYVQDLMEEIGGEK